MPSIALQDWQSNRSAALDGLETAHRGIGVRGPARRQAMQQVNYSYAVALSSQFQAFCRELHSECVGWLAQGVANVALSEMMRRALMDNRKLDRGNPNPGNIGADFGRFMLSFWDEVIRLDPRNA